MLFKLIEVFDQDQDGEMQLDPDNIVLIDTVFDSLQEFAGYAYDREGSHYVAAAIAKAMNCERSDKLIQVEHLGMDDVAFVLHIALQGRDEFVTHYSFYTTTAIVHTL